jgi:hypothetical protein
MRFPEHPHRTQQRACAPYSHHLAAERGGEKKERPSEKRRVE